MLLEAAGRSSLDCALDGRKGGLENDARQALTLESFCEHIFLHRFRENNLQTSDVYPGSVGPPSL